MSLPTKCVYEFGPFRLNPAERWLRCEDKPVSLTPKMFDILLFLVERNGKVVEKEELMCAIWPDTFVEEANLTVNISSLRKALSEVPEGRHYIETVQRRGYRFEAPLKQNGEKSAQANAAGNSNEAAGLRPGSLSQKEIAQPSIAATQVINRMWRSSRGRLLALAVIIIGSSLSLSLHQVIQSRHAQTLAPFQTMKLARLTTNGKAQEAVISPDGKYVLYIIADAGKRSLWVRQVASESNLQIIPPAETQFGGLSFSRDGNSIYFLSVEPGKLTPALYQMPMLGGEAKKLITDISTPVTVSPDGKRLAFLRQRPATGETSLVIVNAEGSGEQILTTRRRPEAFLRTPAWSPDGKIIACQSRTNGGLNYGIIAVSTNNGAEKIITEHQWEANQLAWLADGSGLVMSAIKHGPGLASNNWQLWQVSYPDGETRRITNDLNQYGSISLTADANTLVTVQRDRQSNLWLAPQGQSQFARQITFGSGRHDGLAALAWTLDGRIVYAAEVNGKRKLWLMDSDGSNARSLTPETKDAGSGVVVSPDGRFIIYVSAFDLPHLWRMELTGGEPRQLTFGDGEASPQISPDGEWLIYAARVAETPVLMKMPIVGGAPVQMTRMHSIRPAISPDGKLIAYHHWTGRFDEPPRTQIIPFSGGAPIKSFAFDPQSPIYWSLNGKGLVYIDTRAGVSNLWLQPLDGSAPSQLTDFKSDRIYNYAWSRDGKQLACVRGVDVSDVILISGFR